jgi:hypothetical protein
MNNKDISMVKNEVRNDLVCFSYCSFASWHIMDDYREYMVSNTIQNHLLPKFISGPSVCTINLEPEAGLYPNSEEHYSDSIFSTKATRR